MKLGLGWLVLVAGMALATPASAQYYGKNLPEAGSGRAAIASPENIRIDQNLSAQIPTNLPFVDENGQNVLLKQYFDKKPVVLVLGFYKCRGICTDTFDNLNRTIEGFTKDFVGKDFDVLIVSIDPKEGPTEAADRKKELVDTFKKKEAAAGWHFLTGKLEPIRELADSVGYRFAYAPETGTPIHPAGIIIVTPTAKVSRYFLGTEYTGRLLLDAIHQAGQEQLGPKDDRPFFMACMEIDPKSGKRTMNVLNTVKTLGLGTLAVLVVSIVVMSVKNKPKGEKA